MSIMPEVQAASDAMMELRYVALELKQAAFIAQNKVMKAHNAIMDKPGSKSLAMELGGVEAAFMGFASQHGLVREVHEKLSTFARKHNEDVPQNPAYDEEYIALAEAVTPVKLSNHPRR